MPTGLDEVWRHRQASTRFRTTCTFEGDALVLGAGTKMLDLGRMVGAPPIKTWTRLTALLKAAGYSAPSKSTRLHVQTALLDWWRGERALAQLRLSLLPLPTLRRVEEAYPLFLAEHLLDRGMTPDELLRELDSRERELGKFNVYEDRRPKHSPGGGEWTRGSGSPSASLLIGRSASERSAPEQPNDAGRSLIHPVFLDTEQQQTEVQVAPLLPRKPDNNADPAPQEYQPSILPPPGAPAIDFFPWPGPAPAPAPPKGGGSTGDDDRPDPPACRAEDDVGHGVKPRSMTYEYEMAQLLNPDDPTFKRRPGDPEKPKSQAYYLYSPEAGKEISIDDCNKSGEPSLLIPGMRKGDVVDYKSDGYFTANLPKMDGFKELEQQVSRFNDAVIFEGKGRRAYVCFGRKDQADAARTRFAVDYTQVHPVFCPRRGGAR